MGFCNRTTKFSFNFENLFYFCLKIASCICTGWWGLNQISKNFPIFVVSILCVLKKFGVETEMSKISKGKHGKMRLWWLENYTGLIIITDKTSIMLLFCYNNYIHYEHQQYVPNCLYNWTNWKITSNITQIHFFQCIFYISCMYFRDIHDVHDVHIKNSLLLGIHMTPYFSNKKAQFI